MHIISGLLGLVSILLSSGYKRESSHESLVDRFTNKFTYAILASPNLTEIYDTSLPPKEAAEAYYRIVSSSVKNVHGYDVRGISLIISSTIRDNFEQLTQKQQIQSYGHTVSKTLESLGILTENNLDELCDRYININKENAKYVACIPDRRVALIQAASDGLVHFLTYMDAFKPKILRSIVQNYANFVYSLNAPPSTTPGSPDYFLKIVESLRIQM